jgi:hypothetical protein
MEARTVEQLARLVALAAAARQVVALESAQKREPMKAQRAEKEEE